MYQPGELWPFHPKPKDDELLSSWLVRVAWAHNRTPRAFCSLVWPKEKFTENDLDKFPPRAVIATLAERTAVDPVRVHHTTLLTYEGYLFEEVVPRGITPWILPIGTFHRSPDLYGIPFCPICLAEDIIPYFRKKWRLAYVTICENHRIQLVDRCPHCSKPVNFNWEKKPGQCHADCPNCGDDLTTVKPADVLDIEKHLAWQRCLDDIFEEGGIVLNGNPVHAVLFFMGLRQLVYVLACGKKSRILRDSLTKRIKAPAYIERPYQNFSYIEALSVSERLSLLSKVGWLLEKWPARFSELCRSKRVDPGQLVRNMANVPAWYKSAVRGLYGSRNFPTREEIRSAIDFLLNNGLQVTEPNLELLLGVRLRNIVDFSKYPAQEFRTQYPAEEPCFIGMHAIAKAIDIFGDEGLAVQWLRTPNSSLRMKRPLDLLVHLSGMLGVLRELGKIKGRGRF